MRLFVGLPVSLEATAWILRYRPPLLPAGARWVSLEQWHLTLIFLGEKTESEVESLHAAIAPLLEGHPTLRLRPLRIGWVARTLWVHLQPNPSLEQLVRELHLSLKLPPPSSYKPHITIARARHPLTWVGSDIPDQQDFVFTMAYLYQSELHPSGAEYTPLRRYLFDITLPR